MQIAGLELFVDIECKVECVKRSELLKELQQKLHRIERFICGVIESIERIDVVRCIKQEFIECQRCNILKLQFIAPICKRPRRL